MEQDATQEWISILIKQFKKYFEINTLRKNFKPDKMKTFMEPWFDKEVYRQYVFNNEPVKSATSILILQDSSAIGDFISFTSSVRELRRIYKDAHITLLVAEAVVSLAENCPYVDEILTVNRNYDPNDLKSVYMYNLSMAEKIMHRRYDIAFAFSFGEASSTILLSYMAGAKEIISNPMGLNMQFKSLLTIPAKRCLHGFHAVDDCLSCIDYLLRAPVFDRHPEVWCDAEDINFANELLKEHPLVYGVCVGGSQKKKHYSPEYYAELIGKITEQEDVFFVILGGPSDTQEAQIIEKQASYNNVLNLAGRLSLRQTSAVINCCKYCICNDTGAMHIAAALNVPVLTPSCFPMDINLPFISTVQRWFPYGVPSVIVQPKKALPECKKSQDFLGCRSDSPHCINQIKPEAMFQAFQILKQQVERQICEPLYLETTA